MRKEKLNKVIEDIEWTNQDIKEALEKVGLKFEELSERESIYIHERIVFCDDCRLWVNSYDYDFYEEACVSCVKEWEEDDDWEESEDTENEES